MNSNISKELTSEILNKKLAFFIGAGFDYNSGVPLVKGTHGIMTKILNKLPLNDEDKLQILNASNLPFEAFFEMLDKHSNIDKLLDIFKIGKINLNHIFLAKLAKLGLLNTILTTNFTQFIEKAFEKEGLKKDIDFIVISTDKEMLDINKYKQKIKIIKIHGCISNKQDLVITIQKIAKKKSLEPRKNMINHLFKNANHESVCVMGYSCSDIFDITPLIKSLDVNKNIIFVNHSFKNNIAYNKVYNINYIKNNNAFANVKSGTWCNYNTDILIEKTWDNILKSNLNIPKNNSQLVINNQKVDYYIEEWNKTLSMESSYYISGELLNNISFKKSALKYYKYVIQHSTNKYNLSKTYSFLAFLYSSLNPLLSLKSSTKGLKIATKINNKRLKQIHNKNIGVYYRNKGKYKKSLKYIRKAMKINISNNKHQKGKLYMEFGILLEKLMRYKKANKYFTKAYDIFQNIGSITDKAWSIGHLGNIAYYHKRDYQKAKDYYKQTISMSINMGNNYNVQVYKGNLGNLYLDIGKNKKGLKNLIFALKISKKLNDKIGEGKWLSNIAKYYKNINNLQLASKYIKKSISIAKYLDNKIDIKHRKSILKEYKNTKNKY